METVNGNPKLENAIDRAGLEYARPDLSYEIDPPPVPIVSDVAWCGPAIAGVYERLKAVPTPAPTVLEVKEDRPFKWPSDVR